MIGRAGALPAGMRERLCRACGEVHAGQGEHAHVRRASGNATELRVLAVDADEIDVCPMRAVLDTRVALQHGRRQSYAGCCANRLGDAFIESVPADRVELQRRTSRDRSSRSLALTT